MAHRYCLTWHMGYWVDLLRDPPERRTPFESSINTGEVALGPASRSTGASDSFGDLYQHRGGSTSFSKRIEKRNWLGRWKEVGELNITYRFENGSAIESLSDEELNITYRFENDLYQTKAAFFHSRAHHLQRELAYLDLLLDPLALLCSGFGQRRRRRSLNMYATEVAMVRVATRTIASAAAATRMENGGAVLKTENGERSRRCSRNHCCSEDTQPPPTKDAI
uniref:Uncharacterized protein n=1 Tax=Nelumbo nucifera TaxID=4432 RepID=A0A822XEM1_NELNU|nr:TPA_asm: hypothetical protein HUJ06_020100 [Nelumbo nucifera]